jgi:hypothetical protein
MSSLGGVLLQTDRHCIKCLDGIFSSFASEEGWDAWRGVVAKVSQMDGWVLEDTQGSSETAGGMQSIQTSIFI